MTTPMPTFRLRRIAGILVLSPFFAMTALSQDSRETILQKVPVDGHLVTLSCTKNPNFEQKLAEYLKERESYPERLKEYEQIKQRLNRESETIEDGFYAFIDRNAASNAGLRAKRDELENFSEKSENETSELSWLARIPGQNATRYNLLLNEMELELNNTGALTCSSYARFHLERFEQEMTSLRAQLRQSGQERLNMTQAEYQAASEQNTTVHLQLRRKLKSYWSDYCSETPVSSFGRRVDGSEAILKGRLKVHRIEATRAFKPLLELGKRADSALKGLTQEVSAKTNEMKSAFDLLVKENEFKYYGRGKDEEMSSLNRARNRNVLALHGLVRPSEPVQPQSMRCEVIEATRASESDGGVNLDSQAPDAGTPSTSQADTAQ